MDASQLMFKPDLMKGQRILVTGGGTGLGKEMTEALIHLGADVIICGRRGSVLEETAAELMERYPAGGKVIAAPCDIRVAEAVDEMVEEAFSAAPLTGLINNAAGNFISPTEDLSIRGFDAIANIVFRGTFAVTHSVGRRWIEQGLKGSVVSILVTWVWNGGPFTVPSAMSKAGLHAMTQSLAAEWGRYGIRMNAIAPGPFETKGAWDRLNPGGAADWTSHAVNPMGRMGEMHELCNLATFLLAPGAEYVTGQTIAIDGAQYQATGGNFYGLQSVTKEQWAEMREMIRAANEADKAKRNA